jgi:hypothetical protein
MKIGTIEQYLTLPAAIQLAKQQTHPDIENINYHSRIRSYRMLCRGRDNSSNAIGQNLLVRKQAKTPTSIHI